MVKRIVAISFIFICTTIAWFILAGNLLFRTRHFDTKLYDSVGQLWGTKQIQKAPELYLTTGPSANPGRQAVSLEASDITVDLQLNHRKKGLLWYSTYQVGFAGKYHVTNSTGEAQEIQLDYTFPAQGAIYDNFRFSVGEKEIQNIDLKSGNIHQAIQLAAGEGKDIEISYTSNGLDEWWYDFGQDVNQVRNFSLVMNTDFTEIDFPQETISPTSKETTGEGMKLIWKYSNLLTGVKIGMKMPQKLNPGPWVTKVTSAAPVSLFLFFFLLMVLTTLKKIKLHPMHYFFVAAAFFSFHLLLAYLVDHISIHLAFWICSAVSIFLMISYMRLVVGYRLAFFEIAITQLIYLVLFSYTFFFEGYTGLAITILCIATLFVVMQATGRLNWEEVFSKNRPPAKKPAPEIPREII